MYRSKFRPKLNLPKPFPATRDTYSKATTTCILYSLAAYGRPGEKYEDGYFGGEWRSLGHVEITGKKTKSALLAAFYDGIAQSTGQPLCFEPRHGLRAIRNGKTVDFVICFHCVQMQVFDGTTENPPYVGISNSPKKFFNDLLQQDGVPLASE